MTLSLTGPASVIRNALCVSSVIAMLAGCATPRERIVTKEVRVPIAIACAPTIPPKPSYEGDTVDLNGSIFDLTRALLIEREQRKAEITEVRAALVGCASHPPDS